MSPVDPFAARRLSTHDGGGPRRATSLVSNLSMRSVVSPCIVHRAGQLRLEHCKLTCQSQGLDHLCSPILTLAASPPLW